MKKISFISLSLMLMMFLVAGCKTTQSFKQSISSKIESMTSDVDQKLYAQVPEDKKEGIPDAEFDLELNKNKEDLARLKKEKGIDQLKILGYDLDIASKARKKSQMILDIKKLEAIDRAGLGKKEKNLNDIADLKAETLQIDADIVKFKAKQTNEEAVINGLTKQIEEQEQKIKGMQKK